MKALLEQVNRHKSGVETGIYSVCTANPLVIEAAMLHALKHNETLLIEATSNQVNQYGGYTGLTPKDFAQLTQNLAEKVGFPQDRLILGGDHLGPNCWQDLSAAEAMERSKVMFQEYVRAGFKKLHLDCSMSCADDPTPLGDAEVAARAAFLCKTAEYTWQEVGGEKLVYVIGTEVPVPGGSQDDSEELLPTTAEDAQTTLAIHYDAFLNAGLKDVWPRIIGLVVQPGVEFGSHTITHFAPEKAKQLSRSIEQQPTMLFEAHSTDYQSTQHLKDLVSHHFAILKVGPWLTFAFREACYALEHIEQEWIDAKQHSHLRKTLMHEMFDQPKYWQKYYKGSEQEILFDCHYSLSDRVRYYWPNAKVQQALSTLIENLDNRPPPLPLISQYMPEQYEALQAGDIAYSARALIFHKISTVLSRYSFACTA